MAAIIEAVLAVTILLNVAVLGLWVEAAQKLGKRSRLLRATWRTFRQRCPHTGALVLHFAQVCCKWS